MENTPPVPIPAVVASNLPLVEQQSPSDCSAAQNSIGSSSEFSVQQISRQENPLQTVAEQSQTNSSESNNSRPRRGGHGPWDIADPPTELTPSTNWVRANAVFEAHHMPAHSGDSALPETTIDNYISEAGNHHDETSESPHRVMFNDPLTSMVNESSTDSSLLNVSPKISNSTAPSYDGISDIEPPNEEIYRLRQIEDPRGTNWEVFDLPKTSRARLYLYYICCVRKLRVLCDQGRNMTDLPAHSEEDFALLRTLTRTNGGSRWWTIMIDDLICPECTMLLRMRRRDPKTTCQKAWLKIKSKMRGVCLCSNNNHDFVCHHTRTYMNKVTRFFHALGEGNASRMVNIELDTDPRIPVDIDVLASAVHNAARYFKDAQRISIKFHPQGTGPIEPERIEGIVCSLVKLEAMLPWAHKLHVAGLEYHSEYQRAWLKKSRARKWWMR